MQMQSKIKFGMWEAITLLINLVCTKIFLFYPRMAVEDAGTAGWMMSIFSSMLTFILLFIFMKLQKPFENKDILDIAEHLGGRPLKILIGIILAGIMFVVEIIVIREFSEDMKTISLPQSPLSFIMIFFIIGAVLGSMLGIEAIVRLNAIVVPMIFAAFIVILLGVIPNMDFNNIFPIYGTGLNDIFGNGLLRVSVFTELLAIFLLPPFLGDNKRFGRTGYIVLGFSSVFLLSSSLAYILSFPYPSSLEPFSPIYQMAKLINLGRFFQRIESMFVFIWSLGALLYITSLFYLIVYVIAKSMNLKYLRPLILPMAVNVFSAAFLQPNLISIIEIKTNFIYKTVGLGSFALVALVMLMAQLRKPDKKRGTNE